MRILSILLVASMMQAAPPKISDSLLKERWKALAIHHSNAVRALEMEKDLAKSKAQYEKAMGEIAKACGSWFKVDESGAEAACAPDAVGK